MFDTDESDRMTAGRFDEARFLEASEWIAATRDIVAKRPLEAAPPEWCVRRGWTDWLAALPDDVVDRAEREGLAACAEALATAPVDARLLAARVAALTGLPRATPIETPPSRSMPGANDRKRVQVAAFVDALRSRGVRAERVVDLGSGHGHLTRELATAFDVRADGWDRDADRIEIARAMTRTDRVRFERRDVRSESLDLGRDDLVVALHGCGDLGDLAVRAAGDAAASVAIVGCCLQKRVGPRTPLVVGGGLAHEALTLPHEALGLGNARDGDEGIEADLETRTRSRVNRLALHGLLRAAGVAIDHGEAMRGVNRRWATRSLPALVERAFALRGLAVPSPVRVDAAEHEAWAVYTRARRWALPRVMLGRLVEVWVALDRAASLAERGYAVDLVEVFPREVSPRNVAVVGTM